MQVLLPTLEFVFIAAAVLVALATIALMAAAITGRVKLRGCCAPPAGWDLRSAPEVVAAEQQVTEESA